jgi:hypothetical protein
MHAGWLFELPWAKARGSRTPPSPVLVSPARGGPLPTPSSHDET